MRTHPTAHWIVVLGLAALTGTTVASTISHGDAARRAWGSTRAVAVATRHLDAGTTLTAADVRIATWPVAIAPETALATAPSGRTLLAPVDAGEPLMATRVAPDGLSGVAALVPAGWRAVAIAVPPASLALRAGDHVDLVATTAAGPAAVTVARDALVVAIDGRAVTVAVPAIVVEDVASALAAGAVLPVLRSVSGSR